MKTYEEAGVETSKIDSVLNQLLSREKPDATRDFVEALLKHARLHGSKPVTRQQLAGLVGRDASQAGSNSWAKDASVDGYLASRRASLSQALDAGMTLDWEFEPGKPIYWRTGIREADADESFRLEASVLRYREQTPAIRLSRWGQLQFPGVGSPSQTYRKWVFQAPLLLAVLIFILLSFLMTFAVMKMATASLSGAVSLAMIIALMLLIYRWMSQRYGELLTNRIILVDAANIREYLEGATVEFDHKPGKREVRLRRYVSECPICNAEVHLAAGVEPHRVRLVGRCVDSPQEHIYSFDRVTLEGAPLIARLAT